MDRRRVPRRKIKIRVGVLTAGSYAIADGLELGEGGMLVHSPLPIASEARMVVTFQISGGSYLSLQAVARYQNSEGSVGVEFAAIDFSARRAIRNFVASQGHFEGPDSA